MSNSRVFVSRLSGIGVFDPLGDRVGKLRDVVINYRPHGAPNVTGLVVEVPGRRRVFLKVDRVTSITNDAIITTGLINLRRFAQRKGETRVFAELLGRTVTIRDNGQAAKIEDISIEQSSTGEWHVNEVFLRKPKKLNSPFSKGETLLRPWTDIAEDSNSSEEDQDAEQLLASLEDMQPADLASTLIDLPEKRRDDVLENLDNARLADAIEELGDQDQIILANALDDERFAEVLDHMQPDDAADVVANVEPERRETLLKMMDPEEAADVRTLLQYSPKTAGGLMTTEPVICSADASIAEGLALIRRHEVAPAIAAVLWITLPPYDTPSGRYIGMVHFQKMLRYPPHDRLGTLVDDSIEPLTPQTTMAEVARTMAAYNLVAVPVVDEEQRLLGVVTVDDVLDNMLPENWRDA